MNIYKDLDVTVDQTNHEYVEYEENTSIKIEDQKEKMTQLKEENKDFVNKINQINQEYFEHEESTLIKTEDQKETEPKWGENANEACDTYGGFSYQENPLQGKGKKHLKERRPKGKGRKRQTRLNVTKRQKKANKIMEDYDSDESFIHDFINERLKGSRTWTVNRTLMELT